MNPESPASWKPRKPWTLRSSEWMDSHSHKKLRILTNWQPTNLSTNKRWTLQNLASQELQNTDVPKSPALQKCASYQASTLKPLMYPGTTPIPECPVTAIQKSMQQSIKHGHHTGSKGSSFHSFYNGPVILSTHYIDGRCIGTVQHNITCVCLCHLPQPWPLQDGKVIPQSFKNWTNDPRSKSKDPTTISIFKLQQPCIYIATFTSSEPTE